MSRITKTSCELCPDSKFASPESYQCHRRRFHPALQDSTNKKVRKRIDWRSQCEVLHFENISEFEKWKCELEIQTVSKFVKDSGSWKTKNVTKSKYVCHRSGKSRIKDESKRKRVLSVKGSCKTGEICPAFIRVEHSEIKSKVTVFFNGNHSNHGHDLKYITLPSFEKEKIVESLKNGSTFDEILDGIRDSFDADNEKLTRYHLLTKKDLYNMCKSFLIEPKEHSFVNEYTSIEKMMDAYKEKFGNETPFKLLKAQGSDGPEGTSIDDFLLVIISEAQKKIMQQFGMNGIICIDSIQSANFRSFTLTSVMVVDDQDMGIAAAHLISNLNSSETFLKIFFENIKIGCGDIRAKIFMSDNNPSYINAWETVMGQPEKIFLSTWHFDADIRKNLSRLQGGVELKAEIYTLIRTMMVETNLPDFNELLELTVDRLRTDEATKEFGQYFEKQYMSRAHLWAYAYRNGVDMNTSLKLEALNHDLKHVFLKGAKTKPLDQTICALLKMDRDRIFGRTTYSMNADPSALRAIRKRHKAGKLIQQECISSINSSAYTVTCQSDKFNSYTVTKKNHHCNCNLRCLECNICVHSFTCDCLDNSVQGHICKHVHAVVIHSSEAGKIPDESEMIEEAEIEIEEVHFINVDQEADCDMPLPSLTPLNSSEISQNNIQNSVERFVDKVEEFSTFVQQLDSQDPDNIAACERAIPYLKHVMNIFDEYSPKKTQSSNKAEKQSPFRTPKERSEPYSTSIEITGAQLNEMKNLLNYPTV